MKTFDELFEAIPLKYFKKISYLKKGVSVKLESKEEVLKLNFKKVDTDYIISKVNGDNANSFDVKNNELKVIVDNPNYKHEISYLFQISHDRREENATI